MPTVRTPAGTRIYMASAAAGTAQAISSITKASPGVVTYAGLDPTNGDYLALVDMYGMTELEDALIKTANVNGTSNTFEMEDQDTTGYGTFVSGNIRPVTLDTEIAVATGFSISGGDQKFAEYTFLWDKITRKFPTTKAGMTIDLPSIWDPQDAGSKEVLEASDKSEKRGFKILFPDGLEMLFFGYISSSGLPRADNVDSVMSTSFQISSASRIRYVFP